MRKGRLMTKESNNYGPSPESVEALNEIWMEMFAHKYTWCVQLSVFEGDIGALHRNHLESFERIMLYGARTGTTNDGPKIS